MLFFTKILFTNFLFFLCGKIFCQFVIKSEKLTKPELGIYGSILISFFAILINFFFPLNQIINTIFLCIPFLFLLKFRFISKSDLKFIFFFTIFVCLIIAYSNINTPDAGLYHLPYTQILNETKLILGLNNIHFRFGHISVVQYLSAINYNFITGINGILIPLASLVSYIIFYFFQEIYKFSKNNHDLSINNLFCLYITCYIAYKINRYSGFGNDAVGHLLLFYLLSIFLKTNFSYPDLKKTSIISVFIFLNKVTLLVAFLIPIIIFFKSKKKEFKIFISFSTLFFLMWLAKNILVSGCLIYPFEKTCLNKILWSNPIDLEKQKISGEAWAKGWPDRSNKNIDQKSFIKNFNWIDAWYSVHFKYIINILIPYVIFIFLISTILNLKLKNSESLNFFF